MPRDGLALAVAVRREVQLVDALEQVFQLGDRTLLLRADDVEGFEVVLDVHAEARPRLRFVLRGYVGGVARQVPDVPAGGLDDVVGTQVTSNFACFSRGLDYDESPY